MIDPTVTHRNIEAICAMEEEALRSRSRAARLGDAVASHAGRVWFIMFHVVWFTAWMGFNLSPETSHFDVYPFPVLSLLVALESIFLSLFIIMSQNRSSRQADRRNHLDLQINLLAEDENTKMLQMLKALCDYHGLKIGRDPEIAEMAQRTEVNQVLEDLKLKLPPVD